MASSSEVNKVLIELALKGLRAFVDGNKQGAAAIAGVGTATEKTGKKTAKAEQATRRYGRASATAGGLVGKLTKTVIGLGAAYLGLKVLKDSVATTMDLSKTTGRLGKMFGFSAQYGSELAAVAKANNINQGSLLMTFSTLARQTNTYAAAERGLTAAQKGRLKQQSQISASLAQVGSGNRTTIAAYSALGISTTWLNAHAAKQGEVLDLVQARLARVRSGTAKLAIQNTLLGKNTLTAATATARGARAFHDLGISQDYVRTHSYESTARLILDRLAKMPGGARKAADGATLLGRGWRTLGPILNNGALSLQNQIKWANEFGATVDGHTIKSVSDLRAAQLKMTYAQMGWQIFIGEQLLPALTSLFEIGSKLSKWARRHPTLVKAIVLGVIAWTAATWGLNSALMGTIAELAIAFWPITLIILAVAALALGFIILWTKVKGFRDWVSANWPYLAGALAGPLGIAAVWVIRNWDQVSYFFMNLPMRIVGWLSGLVSALRNIGLQAGAALVNALIDALNYAVGLLNDANFLSGWTGNIPTIDHVTWGSSPAGPAKKKPKKKHGGGLVMDSGGTVPALLQSGEYVVRRQAVNRLGAAFLNRLNADPLNPPTSLANRKGKTEFVGIPMTVELNGRALSKEIARIAVNQQARR